MSTLPSPDVGPSLPSLALEALPSALVAKSFLDLNPTSASYSLETASLTIGAVANIKLAQEAMKVRDYTATAAAGILAVSYAVASFNHINFLRDNHIPNWDSSSPQDKLFGLVAARTLTRAQRFVTDRLGA